MQRSTRNSGTPIQQMPTLKTALTHIPRSAKKLAGVCASACSRSSGAARVFQFRYDTTPPASDSARRLKVMAANKVRIPPDDKSPRWPFPMKQVRHEMTQFARPSIENATAPAASPNHSRVGDTAGRSIGCAVAFMTGYLEQRKEWQRRTPRQGLRNASKERHCDKADAGFVRAVRSLEDTGHTTASIIRV